MNIAATIIDALGGTSSVATDLELTPSTVSSWKTSGRIPKWRMGDVRSLADRRGVDIDNVVEESDPAQGAAA